MASSPYKIIALTNGQTAPFYIVRYNEAGTCISPQAAAAILQGVKEKAYTDLILFSHGWNNDWNTATTRYDAFLQNYQSMMKRRSLQTGREFRPVFVGVVWPSTALVMPWEKGPQIAAGDVNFAESDYQAQLDEVAKLVPADRQERFYDLATRDRLAKSTEGEELAKILAPLLKSDDTELEDSGGNLSPENLAASWAERFPANSDQQAQVSEDFGFAAENGVSPSLAGPLGFLNPRNAIRAFTVWQMKDRAGAVGGGVGRLIVNILSSDVNIRVHMIGHSYGAKVVLSAICAGPLPRKVESLLLLQPAINSWCFAENVWGKNFKGGYRSVLKKVKQPILSTFSKHDKPLTQFFHLAVRRSEDLGEIRTLAAAPSPYAALGGFGPQGMRADEGKEISMLPPGGQRYALSEGDTKIFGIKSDTFIDGHSGIVNEAVSWALFCQLSEA